MPLSARDEHLERVDVAVIGAGIVGLQAAFLLTSLGRRVALLDTAPWIGGSFHLLDRTFPTDSCGLCFMEAGLSPTFCPTLESARNPLLSIHPLTQVAAVEGRAGDFRLTLRQLPRYVDPARCTACGECLAVCPVSRPSFDEGALAPRQAIYRPPWRAVPRAFVIDPLLCTHCGACVEACPEGAVDLDMPAQTLTLHAGAVITAPGFEPFPAERKGEYGFGVLDNVVTSLQFERMISFSGSTRGRLVRPSDGRPARRLAFISCVGSRDVSVGRPYCSSICCMITAKQAAIARELDAQASCTVFYIDLRAQGRDDEYYMARRLNAPGIRYVRCQVSTIKQSQRTRDVIIEYWDEAGQRREESFDLAVLAVGFGPPAEAAALARALGIELNELGFARTATLRPAESSRPGVFAAGAFREPKDIVHSVVEAGAAAALAATLTPAAPLAAEEAPPLRPGLEDEPPRLGIFLGEAGRQYAALLENLERHLRRLRSVARVERIPSLASPAGRDALLQRASEAGLNRLVIVDASPRFAPAAEANLGQVLRGLGLPDSAVELVDMDAWPPAGCDMPARSVNGLWDSVRMAAAGLLRRPLTPRPAVAVSPTPPAAESLDAVVIGGGAAGISAALTMAELGLRVLLVEQSPHLGGHLRELAGALDGEEPAEWLAERIQRMEQAGVRVRTHTTVIRASRQPDDSYLLELASPEGQGQVQASALVIAAGSLPAQPSSFSYGQDQRVMTQDELARRLEAGEDPGDVIMIQCVESRTAERPYCSRTCCAQALRHALRIKEAWPARQVVILYRDLRAFGHYELDYLAARRASVRFVRYEPHRPPQVRAHTAGRLEVEVMDALLGQPIRLPADSLVLSVGVTPAALPHWLQELGVPVHADGFLIPEHLKMRPLSLGKPGIFACGAVLGPCFAEEAVLQGQAAAAHAAAYLAERTRRRAAVESVAFVNERLCSGCELCVRACPFEARVMNVERHVAEVRAAFCAGCGTCAMVCPNGASQQRLFETPAVLQVIDAALDSLWEAPLPEEKPC